MYVSQGTVLEVFCVLCLTENINGECEDDRKTTPNLKPFDVSLCVGMYFAGTVIYQFHHPGFKNSHNTVPQALYLHRILYFTTQSLVAPLDF